MKRIVLPGYGTPHTFNLPADATIGVLANGELTEVFIEANVPTRVEFVKSLDLVAA